MNIIGISGKKGSGKDTFAKLLQKQLELATCKTVKIDSFAANLKYCCALISGQPDYLFSNQDMKDKKAGFLNITNRELMQKFGDLTRSLDKDIWIKSLFNKYLDNPPEYLIVSDVRFKNEAAHINKLGGILIRIESDRVKEDYHISETELDNYPNFDLEISNNKSLTLEELKAKSVDSTYFITYYYDIQKYENYRNKL